MEAAEVDTETMVAMEATTEETTEATEDVEATEVTEVGEATVVVTEATSEEATMPGEVDLTPSLCTDNLFGKIELFILLVYQRLRPLIFAVRR